MLKLEYIGQTKRIDRQIRGYGLGKQYLQLTVLEYTREFHI